MNGLIYIVMACGFASLVGCVSDEQVEVIEFSAEVEESPKDATADSLSETQRLEKVVPRGSKIADNVMDVYALIDARELLKQGSKDIALKKYLEALKLSKGRFSKIVFREWVELYFESLGKSVDKVVAARLIWAETDNGKMVEYFEGSRILNPEALADELYTMLGTKFLEETSVAGDSTVVYPDSNYLESDTLLRNHAFKYCRETQKELWNEWIKKLPAPLEIYWQARVSHCEKKFRDAATLYENFISNNQGSSFNSVGDYALESAYQLTAIYRWIDLREKLANAYSKLASIWDVAKINQKLFDSNETDFRLRQINDRLWAARYLALIGDFDLAQKLSIQALKLAEALDSTQNKLEAKQLKIVKEYRAEAHHILAYRISLERGELDSSINHVELGLEVNDLSDEWRDRFKWYKAFYQYLSGNYENARRNFEDFLGELDEKNDYRDRVYYWLSKTYKKLNREDESEFYQKALAREYPASFYTIVPSAEENLVSLQKYMNDFFGAKADLFSKLRQKKKFDLGKLKSTGELKRLLIRAQILAKAEIPAFAKDAVQELMESAKKTNLNLEQLVYLSRLHHIVGDHFGAISITAQIQSQFPNLWTEYPEQILVYYPMAYMNSVQKHSLEFGLEPEDILAVARQESSFRSTVRSPAGAVGLMQLMPQTAMKFGAVNEGEADVSLEDILKNTDKNIQLGANLLKDLFAKYQGRKAPAFAAYNAGEFVVDIWLQRRSQDDSLLWVEIIPFGETAGYVKNVMRNYYVYKYLRYRPAQFAQLLDSNLFSELVD